MNTQDYDAKIWMTINECLKASGYHNAHFRMHILKEGRIEHKKEMITGTQIPRVLVKRASFEKYMKEHPRAKRIVLTADMKKLLKEPGYDIEG